MSHEPAKNDKPDEQTVHVLHVGEVENVNFKISSSATLQEVWDKAYVELAIARAPRDSFQAVEGGGPDKKVVDLTTYLGRTLAEAESENLTKTRHFEIVADTGGA